MGASQEDAFESVWVTRREKTFQFFAFRPICSAHRVIYANSKIKSNAISLIIEVPIFIIHSSICFEIQLLLLEGLWEQENRYLLESSSTSDCTGKSRSTVCYPTILAERKCFWGVRQYTTFLILKHKTKMFLNLFSK